ncbi:trypsin-like peptidase domain-containing protein [Streptomyces sp. APSN-46.1]|uniref:trypsin-like serine peptidase n=1 Tax=Streptomyces sp. APSN-46.1 TaxID=2929049 RepID=UPI001FB2A71F|nr:trypsin-like peptidase domain-containing protein [Streptomyces sp. APSN-46.1]MCJ1680102.1 trypsin-like peptidase domain-containing protein [Streptomyces sp. APSN-46.1]
MFTKDHRRALRGAVLMGVWCALVLGSAGCAWQLGGLAGQVADGDPAQGTYVQDPGLGDSTAAAVLDGIVREVPAPEAPEGTVAAEDSVPWRASEPLVARTAAPEPAIGALFSPGDGDSDHHCSASVVHSPGGNLIATAAHCVHQGGFRTNLAFVPGYRDGGAPYGVWVPERIDVDPRWTEDFDPDHDVAFLRLRRPGHPGARLEDLTGAQTLRVRPELPAPARVVGYPNDAERPLDCRNTARAAGPTQLRLDCADVPDGTSGGPVLTGAHTLIGVIGGRDGGGDEETSYSSYFDAGVLALYERSSGG